MFNGFYYLFQKIQKYPKTALLSSLLFLVCAVFILQKITFNEDITRIIPSNKTNNSTAQVINEMNFTDKIAVFFKKKTATTTNENVSDAAQQFADTLPELKEYYDQNKENFRK